MEAVTSALSPGKAAQGVYGAPARTRSMLLAAMVLAAGVLLADAPTAAGVPAFANHQVAFVDPAPAPPTCPGEKPGICSGRPFSQLN